MKKDIPATLGGRDFIVRAPISVLIEIEEELGVPLASLKDGIFIKQICTIVKRSYRTPEGLCLAENEWREIFESIDAQELTEAFQTFTAALTPTEGDGEEEEEGEQKNE